MPWTEEIYLKVARFGVRGLLTLLAITMLGVLMWLTVGVNLSDFAQGAILMAIGKALGWLDMIYNFEYGSSRTSQAKDATIQTMATNAGETK